MLPVYADSRFAEPRNFLQRGRFYVLFASCKKNQKARQRFANLWTPGTIQIAGRYVFEAKVTGFHQVTGYAENYNFPGIAGNDLNRCDVRALQHKIRAKMKRTAAFFANSRLRVFGMGGGGWKRVVLDSNKKGLCKGKAFFSIQKIQIHTAPKLTCSYKFHLRKPTVSLQYNNPFSKNIRLASALR